jgi:cell division protease FtsH
MKDALMKYETIDAEQVDSLMAREAVRPPADWDDEVKAEAKEETEDKSENKAEETKTEEKKEDTVESETEKSVADVTPENDKNNEK